MTESCKKQMYQLHERIVAMEDEENKLVSCMIASSTTKKRKRSEWKLASVHGLQECLRVMVS